MDGKAIFVGTVSWGTDCALDGYPGVYVRIDKYYDWIEEGKWTIIANFKINIVKLQRTVMMSFVKTVDIVIQRGKHVYVLTTLLDQNVK